MVKRNHPRYSEKTITEICSLYQSGEEVAEINRTYNLAPTTIYHFLKSRGIPSRQKSAKNGTVVEPEMPVPDGIKFAEDIRRVNSDLRVTTDKEGFVQSAQRKGFTSKFEVGFTGILEVEANTLEDAIAYTKKRLFVQRIHSVREK